MKYIMDIMQIPGATSKQDIDGINQIAKTYWPKLVLEIGGLAGRSAIAWSRVLPRSHIWVVDPFRCYRLREMPIVRKDYNFSDEEYEEPLYKTFLKYTQPYDNIRHIRIPSDELVRIWPGPKFDLCFIDGDHSVNGLSNDLETAETITNRGIICGHDYNNPEIPHFNRVVDAWALKRNYHIYTIPDTWLFVGEPR